MVEFFNVRVEGEYIYAVERDDTTGEVANVKIHVSRGEYYANPPLVAMDMKKAIWNLQRRYKTRKKLECREVIAWG